MAVCTGNHSFEGRGAADNTESYLPTELLSSEHLTALGFQTTHLRKH